MKSPEPKLINVSLSSGVTIQWTDGHASPYDIRSLRKSCPCATCQDLHGTGSKHPQGPEPANSPFTMYQPVGATLTSVQPVGRYGLQFFFSDGHSAGIYTWEYLRLLCPCPQCQPQE